MFPRKIKDHYPFYLDDKIAKQKEGYSVLSDKEKEQVEDSIVGDDREDDTTGPGPGQYQQRNNVSFLSQPFTNPKSNVFLFSFELFFYHSVFIPKGKLLIQLMEVKLF